MSESGRIYAQFTLSRIKRALRDEPLTESQQEAIFRTLTAEEPSQRHTLDIRLFFPALFRSYYLVLLAGRDRRGRTIDVQRLRFVRTRRTLLKVIVNVALILLSFLMAGFAFWGLYTLKSALGVDLIPDYHLSDLISNLLAGSVD